MSDYEDVDWDGDSPTTLTGAFLDGDGPATLTGAFLYWGWPEGSDYKDMDGMLQEIMQYRHASHHRFGIQLKGEQYPDLSEHSDKTWWTQISYYRELPSTYQSTLADYMLPKLVRNDKSVIVWIPNVVQPPQLLLRDHLSNAIVHLPDVVLSAMQHAAEKLKEDGSLPKGSLKLANVATKQLSNM